MKGAKICAIIWWRRPGMIFPKMEADAPGVLGFAALYPTSSEDLSGKFLKSDF